MSCLLVGIFLLGLVAAQDSNNRLMGANPNLPIDPNTSTYCSWYWDNLDGQVLCSDILQAWQINLDDFRRWNPSINADCSNLQGGRSYCIEAWDEPDVPAVTTTTTGTSITQSQIVTTTTVVSTTQGETATTTTAGTSVQTPQPIQPGMVSNCNRFYFVKSGDRCDAIAASAGINLSQFHDWNPLIGTECVGIWANVNVCTGIIGLSPGTLTTITRASTTTAFTGITTPQPIQPGMVADCNRFYFVQTDDGCDAIAARNGISPAQFHAWNPQIGTSCAGLWANVNVCIGVIGSTPTTRPASVTTTTAGNGIATPTPIQPGVVSNCNRFYLVKTDDGCDAIAARHGISPAQFHAWNPQIGTSCAGLWANVNVCVGVVGSTPTTTLPPSNGVATPSPTQPNIVANCARFYFVKQDETCDTVAKINGITVAQLKEWNRNVGSNCGGLWANAYACVRLI
ncbi:hypothetical protein B0T11DRAFT_338432 [Plectosphaerella cucumerina]|uniref:LysM domain-containing protein n=1 Tax=Plectosphaerella cucumerina TaxID=40658 RepID=A0A8K0TQ06_9PEZI|nr:hypothetical protein B0T11DRAFT_338432 [Plectosphaerella cucumerina]